MVRIKGIFLVSVNHKSGYEHQNSYKIVINLGHWTLEALPQMVLPVNSPLNVYLMFYTISLSDEKKLFSVKEACSVFWRLIYLRNYFGCCYY